MKKISCSISGVPRITSRYPLINHESGRIFDILPKAIIRPNGREMISVNENSERVVKEVSAIRITVFLIER